MDFNEIFYWLLKFTEYLSIAICDRVGTRNHL